jgi:hypothetical protein
VEGLYFESDQVMLQAENMLAVGLRVARYQEVVLRRSVEGLYFESDQVMLQTENTPGVVLQMVEFPLGDSLCPLEGVSE